MKLIDRQAELTRRSSRNVRLRQILRKLGPLAAPVVMFFRRRPDFILMSRMKSIDTCLPEPESLHRQQIETMIAEDLGRDGEQLLVAITDAPYATDGLVQWHQATLPDGQDIVIKFLRPDAVGLVDQLAGKGRRIKELFRELRGPHPVSHRQIMSDLTCWLRGQIDFEKERDNLVRLNSTPVTPGGIRPPIVFEPWCGPRVLALRQRRLPTLSSILAATGPADDLKSLAATAGFSEIDLPITAEREELAENLIVSFLIQAFVGGYFVTATTPDNIVVRSDKDFECLSFSDLFELNTDELDRQSAFIFAVYAQDPENMARAIARSAGPESAPDHELLITECNMAVRSVLGMSPTLQSNEYLEEAQSYHSPVSRALLVVLGTFARRGVSLPNEVVALHRALICIEETALALNPALDSPDISARAISKIKLHRSLAEWTDEEIRNVVFSLANFVREAPEQLSTILSDAVDGRLSINMQMAENTRTARAWNNRTLFVATAIASLGPAFLLSRSDLPEIGGISAAWFLAGLLGVIYGWMILQWKQLR